MDKVIIYDVFEFIGFHLGKRLLDKGYSVNGIHFNTKNDSFLDEKRLEIGRNANFLELEDFNEAAGSEPAMIIISLYEWFMSFKDSGVSDTRKLSQIVETLNERKEEKDQMVYLLPIQLLTDSPQDIGGVTELKEFLNQTSRTDQCVQLFYLPTIFGPWQPPSFLFQRMLLKQLNKHAEQDSIREWPLDAIYIDDALETLIERIETANAGSCMLESGIPDSWARCADFLKADQSLKSEQVNLRMNEDEKIVKLTLKQVTPYEEALEIQRKHLSRALGLEEE